MKKYKLEIALCDESVVYNKGIPDGVRFYKNPDEIGRYLRAGCAHYMTVVETEKYKKWIDSFTGECGIYAYSHEIGKYTVVTIENLHEPVCIPTVDRDEWFETNKIDFGQYVLARYDGMYNLCAAYRIQSFKSIWDIDARVVTRRQPWCSDGRDCYGMRCEDMEYDAIWPSELIDDSGVIKTFEGADADALWNTMIHDALDKFSYDPAKAESDYDFDAERKKLCETLGVESLEEFFGGARETSLISER